MEETFGRYTLIRRLAVGGMAEIFLAALHGDAGFEKKVVVKRILPHLSADETFVRMFVDEAKVAARLTHPNIIQTYDFGCVSGSHYIAMEYVDGVDLNRLLRQAHIEDRRLLPAQVAALGERIARGLAYTHRLTDDHGTALGIVHRDISPHNIMISFTGEVKVMDFGIAKAAARATQTAAGTIKGKLAYMSPEQAAGDSATRYSDQYALGIVLWECLSGQRLFCSDHEIRLIQRVKAGEVTPLHVIRTNTPPALEAIVMRALQKNPAARYVDLEHMHNDLMAFRYSLGAAGMVQLGPLARACERIDSPQATWSWANDTKPPMVTRILLRASDRDRLATGVPLTDNSDASKGNVAVLAPAPVQPTHLRDAVVDCMGHVGRADKVKKIDKANKVVTADKVVKINIMLHRGEASKRAHRDTLAAGRSQATALVPFSPKIRRSQESLLLHLPNPKRRSQALRRTHRSRHHLVPRPLKKLARRILLAGLLALIAGSVATLVWHCALSQSRLAVSQAPPRVSALRMFRPRVLSTGRLSLSTEGPDLDVYLGTNCLGTTPLVNEQVPAGHLALRLINADAGMTRWFEIDVPAGGSARGVVTTHGVCN